MGFTDLTGGLSLLNIVELGQLFDVDITSPTNGQVLTYNSSTGEWVNGSGGGGGSVQSVTGLNTDNADPANPVVKISVDGATITGLGTPASPLVAVTGGGGTVTDVSVVSANGFAGTVATSTSTPAITMQTTVTGIVKGNGTAFTAASAGTDYTNLAFKTISVSGQSDVVADSAEDTLTLAAGSNITITTNASTDTITIAASGGGGTPGGSNTQVQYNNSGSFGGITGATTDGTALTLVAPILGTPASGNLSNCTNYSANSLAGTTLASNVTASSLTSLGSQAQALNMNSHLINNLANPVSGTDAVNLTTLQSYTSGLSGRTSCRVATTANIVGTYSNGSSGVGATITYTSTGVDTIDGITIALNDRILVKDQNTTFQNGIYTITTLGAIGIAGILTRATDFDQPAPNEVVEGAYTVIEEGTANAGTFWIETGQGPFTIGSTAITFTELLVGPQTVTLTGAVTGSGAGTVAATIATPGTLTVSSSNSTATAHTHAITSSSAPGAAASILATDSSGIIGSTGTRIVKGWFTDLTVTNNISGSITGNAATVTTNANLTGAVTSSGNATTLVGSIPFSAPSTVTIGNATVYLMTKAAFSGTINSLLGAQTTSGTITVAIKINGTNVTGLSAVAVTSTPADTNASAANTFAAGDVITAVTSSSSSDLGLSFNLKITRT